MLDVLRDINYFQSRSVTRETLTTLLELFTFSLLGSSFTYVLVGVCSRHQSSFV